MDYLVNDNTMVELANLCGYRSNLTLTKYFDGYELPKGQQIL